MHLYLNIFLAVILQLPTHLKHETYISITDIMVHEDERLEISIELIAHDFEYSFKKEMNKL